MSDLNFTECLSKNCNVIEQVTVEELLDGRYFFIPSYQRGYRWTKKQIYDLCNDLLEYILKNSKKDGTFYSLQPLIVRKGMYKIAGADREAYEVVDGQQRLTTIFILYRFLAKELKYTSIQEVSRDYSKKELYHIYYQTRPDDYAALEKSGFTELTTSDIKDIDIAHISNAYHYMHSWLYNNKEDDSECAESTFIMFSKEDFATKTVKDLLFNLINNCNTSGSLQFILYELDMSKDAIREFLSENKGKIHLTDTEKIRALFMQRSNFENDIKNLKQLSIAKDWELIENTLHRNDFWSFISKDADFEDGRITKIFEYLFEKDPISKDVEPEGDYLFRYYYQIFARIKKKGGAEKVSTGVDDLWNDVMECFRMLQNWFYNPKVYNLVGLLVKHGHSIKKISAIYNMKSVVTNDDFIKELNCEIRRELIDSIPIEKGNPELGIGTGEEYIKLFYNVQKEKEKMPDLFRFLNVMEINKTIDNALSEVDKEDDEKKKSDIKRSSRDVISHIYRFPFEALDAFGWDIEHVDSATTNSLNEPKEQLEWLAEAEKSLNDILSKDAIYLTLKDAYSNTENKDKNGTLKNMVGHIHEITGETESDDQKNWIGNLTLLDSGTNRSYQNKIFAWKGNVVKNRIQAGVFVPVCTQNIFNKSYSGCSQTRWKWSIEDKRAYHEYMLKSIKDFKQKYPDKPISESCNNVK